MANIVQPDGILNLFRTEKIRITFKHVKILQFLNDRLSSNTTPNKYVQKDKPIS